MKRLFGKWFALLLAGISIFCFCNGCDNSSENSSTVTISAQDFADTLYQKIPLDAELKANRGATMALLMNITGYSDAAGYAATGTVPDMIAVFCGADDAAVKAIQGSMESYLQEMAREYERYAPEQVDKLEDAIIVTGGSYAVLCVTPDPAAAKKIVDEVLATGKSNAVNLREPAPKETTTAMTSTTTTATSTQQTTTTVTTPPLSSDGGQVISPQGDYQLYDVVVRDGDTVYECYYYNDNFVTQYANALNQFAAAVPDTVQVYSMMIPNSMGITLPDEYVNQVPSTNQRVAIEKLNAKLQNGVQPVSLYDTLRAHRSEYIYFRTDHHWTALGAYYAFSALCAQTGKTVPALSDMETKRFEGFLGTFYRDTNEHPKLAANPDFVDVYYVPQYDSISMEYFDADGAAHNWPLLADVTDYTARMKYGTFAGGDHAKVVTKNSALQDGSVCILIKESYGNALIPFLAGSYETVYAFDYRHDARDLAAFTAQYPNADVVFANNVSMIQSSYLVGKLAAYLS